MEDPKVMHTNLFNAGRYYFIREKNNNICIFRTYMDGSDTRAEDLMLLEYNEDTQTYTVVGENSLFSDWCPYEVYEDQAKLVIDVTNNPKILKIFPLVVSGQLDPHYVDWEDLLTLSKPKTFFSEMRKNHQGTIEDI